ncbi:MAG: hypothetical protein OEV92_12490 [Nitrospinota bacterium]|nr:hypothetical protein [Nitrospinota bacterium]
MKQTKRVVTRQNRKPRIRKSKELEVTFGKTHCYHCGGMLRVMPDEVSCVNCGRLADHKCERCMYKEVEAAV